MLKDLDIKIVILSRSRYDSITTTKLLPEYIEVVVPESQKELYKHKIKNPIVTTTDNIIGLGKLRNWCLDNFSEETIIMLDDDITCFYCLTGAKSKRITEPDVILEILVNTAIMAKDIKTNCFGFSQTDIRKYKATDPFNLCTWVGGVIGVIGKNQRFRNDKYKVDIDFCLQSLLNKRIVFQNCMYWAAQMRDNNIGGNSEFRTSEEYNKSLDSLKEKWGNYVKVYEKHSQKQIKLNVGRKQVIKL